MPKPDPDRGPARRVLRGFVRAALPPISPVIKFFDTRIPLPWAVYRVFYYHYMLPRVRSKLRLAGSHFERENDRSDHR